MKLAILTQYFYPEMGAPPNRLLELSKGFKEKGWDVSVVTALPNYPRGKIFDGYKGKFSAEENKDGISIKRYWLYASVSARAIPRIISMLSFSFTSLFSASFLKKKAPDYLFVESPPLTLAFSALLLSKFIGTKLIMNVSDIWPLSAKELGVIGDGFLYKRLESFERYLYKKSFICSGQSEEITAHIQKSGGKSVYLFRNGVDVRRFKVSNREFNKGDNIKIVYAGLLGVAQGIYEISRNIDFKELGAELHIYGEGAEKEKLMKYLKENPGKNIILKKAVSRKRSRQYCPNIIVR
ncbi:MAG: glycosyltransferase family 4 protein [Ignavibacteria bacterium]|nr:glycosyltransferase family 4 protein [Ignavibacteria bacterium]